MVASLFLTLPLLNLDLQFSHRLPELSVEAHCSLELQTTSKGSEYHVLSTVFRDFTNGEWQTESRLDLVLKQDEIRNVLNWISESRSGPFKQKQNPCDIGTLVIATPEFPLIDSKECENRVENLNPSATPLISWFRKACSIDKKSALENQK